MDWDRINNYDALKGRLLCYAALKDDRNFEAQLPATMKEFETYRAKIFEEQNRNTFFDREQGVYDLAINTSSKQTYLGAVELLQRNRARDRC
jgi:hypothetical protein